MEKYKEWFVYILACCDGTLYTGITTDVTRRVDTHNSGKGGKYTRSRLPVRLEYSEESPGRPEALKREAEIKKWPRKRKLALIKGG